MDDGTYQFFQGRNVLPLSSAKPSLQTTFAGVQRSSNLKSTVNLKRKIESSHHASGIQKSSATGSYHPKEWSLGEEKKIREPRSMDWGWTAISGELPGRSSIACRLHFQNVLEPKLRWNEEEKTKFARLYDRFKMEMWSQVALQMGMPWRAAEAMHWQLGENDISCRATGCMQLGIHDSPESPAMGSFVKPLSCKYEEFAGTKSPNLSLPSFKEAFSDLPDDQ